MIRFISRGMALCLTVPGLLAAVPEVKPPTEATPPAQKGPEKPDVPSHPKFEEVTKEMQAHAGLFTLWYYPPELLKKAQERGLIYQEEKLLCQVPFGFIGKKFMLSTSVSGGGMFTGFPLDERVVQWQIFDNQLVLIEPETGNIAKDDAAVRDVVERTYPDRIRATLPILTRKGLDPIVDLGPLLKSDFANVGSWVSFGSRGGGINTKLSKWTKKKSFPLNVEIGVELAVASSNPPGSFDKRMVHYSFWQLPETGYQPRVADDRIGYFLTAYQDWAKPHESRDLFQRYIDRWQLEKRDPSLEFCEPKQPIIFYIEKTVPVRFRQAVRDGILEWNKAFQEIGFVSAIEVRQQTHDNEWKDIDPEDMRFSFFRWIVTGQGFAMGPHRANPYTGQIYDADIIFDDSMVRYFEEEATQRLPDAIAARKFSDPALGAFIKAHPQWGRPKKDWHGLSLAEPEQQDLRVQMRERLQEQGKHLCDYADGMRHQLLVGRGLLAGQSKEVRDRLLYDVVKEVVMHEVGHTLGLRHNFRASSIWSIEEIRKRKAAGLATAGSVMDYNPVLFFKDKATEGNFLTPTLGPYDFWAIEYGYIMANKTPQPPKKTEEKKEEAKEPESIKLSGQEISKEVLEQLPEEVKKMIRERALSEEVKERVEEKAPPAAVAKQPPAGELKLLQAIASRAAEPELAYATDEDTTTMSPEPRANRFDAGSDPLDWAATRIELIDARLADILNWGVEEGESWYHLRDSFLSLWTEKAFVMDYVGRYIGGQYISRAHRGDPNAAPPFEVVPAERQREALQFIEKHLFNDEFFGLSAKVLNHLTVPRWYHRNSYVNYVVDFPAHDYVSLMQWWNLFDRLYPNTLRRIYDAELKFEKGEKFTTAEYLQTLQRGCWKDVIEAKKEGEWNDAKPFSSSFRRSLQREYLSLMESLARSRPGTTLPPDVHAMVQQSLRDLAQGIKPVVESGKLDFASKAHLASSLSRIERMLEPELNEQGGVFF